MGQPGRLAGLCLSSDFAPQGWEINEDFAIHLFLRPCEGRNSDENGCLDTLDRRPGSGGAGPDLDLVLPRKT
jgi:hypothetical protein